MTIVDPANGVSVERVQKEQPSASSTGRRRRRRLSQDEALEVARLYAETDTPTSEIRARFGIADSSLYRIVQRQGMGLRGRTASGPRPNTPLAQTPAARRRRAARPAPPATARTSEHRHQFRILFLGERVVRATDIADALRQAESFGAIEITTVSRAD